VSLIGTVLPLNPSLPSLPSQRGCGGYSLCRRELYSWTGGVQHAFCCGDYEVTFFAGPARGFRRPNSAPQKEMPERPAAHAIDPYHIFLWPLVTIQTDVCEIGQKGPKRMIVWACRLFHSTAAEVTTRWPPTPWGIYHAQGSATRERAVASPLTRGSLVPMATNDYLETPRPPPLGAESYSLRASVDHAQIRAR